MNEWMYTTLVPRQPFAIRRGWRQIESLTCPSGVSLLSSSLASHISLVQESERSMPTAHTACIEGFQKHSPCPSPRRVRLARGEAGVRLRRIETRERKRHLAGPVMPLWADQTGLALT